MQEVVPVINSLSYSLAFVILLSTFITRSRERWVVGFIVVLAADLWLAENIKFQTTILLIPTSAAVFWSKSIGKHQVGHYVYRCMTAVYIIWIMALLFASPFMILLPEFQSRKAFSLLMAMFIPICAEIMKKHKKRTSKLFILEHGTVCSMSIQLIVISFFNFLMPVIGIQDARISGAVILSVISVLILVSMLHHVITTETIRARGLSITNKQAMDYCRLVQDKYEAVITAMHYLPKLYGTLQIYIQKQDFDGLQAHFSQHVAPILDEYILERSRLDNISNEQIRNLVQITFGQVNMMMRHIRSELRIDGEISIPKKLSMLVFETMSNLIDNALQHIKLQRQGYFKLEFILEDKCLIINVINSLSDGQSVNEMYNDKITQSARGFGLRRVCQIACTTSDIELFTYIKGELEGMMLLTQGIKIWLGDIENESDI